MPLRSGGEKTYEEMVDSCRAARTGINRKTTQERRTQITHNEAASYHATMEVETPTSRACRDHVTPVGGEINTGSALMVRSTPGYRLNVERERDFRMGNVQAKVRSDLLITRGNSEHDTVYLIKREETREAEDFWLKVDRARNGGAQTSRGESNAIGYRAQNTIRVEQQESHNVDSSLKEQHAAPTRNSTSAAERQTDALQCSKLVAEAFLAGAHEALGDESRFTRGERSYETSVAQDLKPTSDCSSPRGGKQETVAFSSHVYSSSLSQRALQLLRGTRRNTDKGDHTKSTIQGRQLKNEDQQGQETRDATPPFIEVDADSVSLADIQEHVHFDNNSSHADASTTALSELQNSLRRNQACEDALGSVCPSSRGLEGGAAGRRNSTPSKKQQNITPDSPSVSMERRSLTAPSSPLAALFARAGLKIQEASAHTPKSSAPGTTDREVPELPHTMSTSSEGNERSTLHSVDSSAQGHSDTRKPSVSAWTKGIIGRWETRQDIFERPELQRVERDRNGVSVSKTERLRTRTRVETYPQKEHRQKGEEPPGKEFKEAQYSFGTKQESTLWRRGDEKHVKDSYASVRGSPLLEQRQKHHGRQQHSNAEKDTEGHFWNILKKRNIMVEKARGSEDRTELSTVEARGCISRKKVKNTSMAIECEALLESISGDISEQKHTTGEEEEANTEKKRTSLKSAFGKERKDHSPPIEQGCVRTRTPVMNNGKRKEHYYWVSMAATTRRSEQASCDARGIHYSRRRRTEDVLELQERPRVANFFKRCHSVDGLPRSRSTRSVSLHSTVGLQETQSAFSKGSDLFHRAVRSDRGLTEYEDVNATEMKNCLSRRDSKKRSCAYTIAETRETKACPTSHSEGEECSWQSCAPGRSIIADSCDAEALTENKQKPPVALEGWLLFKHAGSYPATRERISFKTPRTTQHRSRSGGGDTTKEVNTLYSLGSRSTTAEAGSKSVEEPSTDKSHKATLQRLRDAGGHYKTPWKIGDRPATNTRRSGQRGLASSEESTDTKRPGIQGTLITASGMKPQYHTSPVNTKRDLSSAKQLLRTMMRGGGHRADELAHRWLHDSSSEVTSNNCSRNTSRKNQRKERKSWTRRREKPRTEHLRGSTEEHWVTSSLAEEERISQSSTGISLGWINVEKPEDENDEHHLMFENELSAVDMEEHSLCSRERQSKMSVKQHKAGISGDTRRIGESKTATSVLSPTSVEAAARYSFTGSSGSGVNVGEGDLTNSSSSVRKDLTRRSKCSSKCTSNSSMEQDNGYTRRSNMFRRSQQATSIMSDDISDVEMKRKTVDASNTWDQHFHGEDKDGCVLTEREDADDNLEKGGGSDVKQHHLTAATVVAPIECRAEESQQTLIERKSPASSVSSHAGWETLETTTTVLPKLSNTPSVCDNVASKSLRAVELREAINTLTINTPAIACPGGVIGDNVWKSQDQLRDNNAVEKKKDEGNESDLRNLRDSDVTRQQVQEQKESVPEREMEDEATPIQVQQRQAEAVSMFYEDREISLKRNNEIGDLKKIPGLVAVESPSSSPPGSGISLLNFFGSAAGWNFLKKGWKKQNAQGENIKEDEEKTNDVRQDNRDGKDIILKKNIDECNAQGKERGPVAKVWGAIHTTANRDSGTHLSGRSPNSAAGVCVRVHKRHLLSGNTGGFKGRTRSNSKIDGRKPRSSIGGGTRKKCIKPRYVIKSNNSSRARASLDAHTYRRSAHLRSSSSSVRLFSQPNINDDIIGWDEGKRILNTQSRSGSSVDESVRRRSMSSHTFVQTNSINNSDVGGSKTLHTEDLKERNIDRCASEGGRAGSEEVTTSWGNSLRNMDVSSSATAELLLQPIFTTGKHTLLASSYALCRKRLPDRTGSAINTSKRRPGSRVPLSKPLGKSIIIAESRRQRGNVLEPVEKASCVCSDWKDGTKQLLHVASRCGDDAIKALQEDHVDNNLRQSQDFLGTSPLGPYPYMQAAGDRTCCRKSNNRREVQEPLQKCPCGSFRRQLASAGEEGSIDGHYRLPSAFLNVCPLSGAAAGLFTRTPHTSASGTDAFVGTSSRPGVHEATTGMPSYASHQVTTAVPLCSSGIERDTGKFVSSLYVSGTTTGCFSRLLPSASGAAPPAVAVTGGAALGTTRPQATYTLAQEVLGADTLLLTAGRHATIPNAYTHLVPDSHCNYAANATSPFWCRWPAAMLRVVGLPLRTVIQLLGLNVSGAYDRWRAEIRQRSLRGFLTLCLLDGVVCAAAVWGVCHLALVATRGAFKTAYLHVHNIDAERTSHYFDGLTYRFWGKRPLYFTDNPLVGAGRAVDADIATDPWSGLHHLQQRGIAWYQHRMYGDL